MSKEEQFVQLIQDHQGLIFKVTTVYTNNKIDQQDLYQDIVYQLWKSFDGFRNESKISTWMYRVALNTALTKLKKNTKRPKSIPIEKVVLQQTENYDYNYEEQLKLVYAQIQQLNVLEKALMLLLLEGKKYDEIAEIIGITASNVGTKISRIKQKLKNNILKQ
ncbi:MULTISPECIES: RNA polymerase sigma factor [unclassified Cellulophaga]|uniref:RNA polymerase sigma factor n=1 Tax=unclassified Cellulophaga TaxID=2634405 RepID=UPI0026E29091|nr:MULTISPECIES: sigma-70 family RNA polymerase sigma factor [unclassified Cellulophaga]MDO6491665.1 sigma-70 family RNA polymerase sigma factor [Cellulophaga sp. 2_MG-2023]MDO6493542.1 sigma-70 family RNA polymerase sigma factor [Cellulophaga sp. 3_MG-2023]